VLTVIWQANDFREREWIEEIFGDSLGEHVYDGRHEMVADDCLLVDKFIHLQPKEYYQQFARRKNVYLVHLSDEQYAGGYEAYAHFNGVIRNYWSSVFDPRSVLTIPLGYSNGVSGREARPITERKYVWSFAGEAQRSSRPEMLASLKAVTPHCFHSTDRTGAAVLSPGEYQAVLADTIFAPCPMGHVNLESFRIYEALECGAIPIVEERLALDYFSGLLGKHPLLTVLHWNEAQTYISALLEDTTGLLQKQAELRDWWTSKKETVRADVSKFLSTRSDVSRNLQKAVSWRSHLPLWQVVELSRHHSAPALVRRIKKEVGRFGQHPRELTN
jgi:hypothetical protein